MAPGGGGGGYWVESGGGGPVVGAQAAGPPAIAGGAHEGGRAVGIAGAFVGALLGASALVWALYKCKVLTNKQHVYFSFSILEYLKRCTDFVVIGIKSSVVHW